jgi:predicted Fe-Mo cluster-binding NifX family protein
MHYVAIPTDGGAFLAHFGRARVMAVFSVEDNHMTGREDRLNPDPDHLDPAHHRIMLDLVRGCHVVIAAHIGPPMITSLVQRGVQVLGAPTESVEGAIGAYLRSLLGGPELEVLTATTADGRHAHLRVP